MSLGLLLGGLDRVEATPVGGCRPPAVTRNVVELAEPWRDRGDGWSVRARLRSSAWPGCVELARRDVWLTWPEATRPPTSTRLRIVGRLRIRSGPFNGQARVRERTTLSIRSPLLAEEIARDGGASPVDSVVLSLRQALERAFPPFSRGGGPGRSVGGALLLGDSGRLPPELSSSLRRLGLAHLMAASGLHVGVLWVGLSLLWAASHGRARLVGPLLGVWLFVLVVGPRPSLQRAGLAAVLAIGARLGGRWIPVSSVLGATALLLVGSEPRMAGSLGFRLSYAACAGIALLAAPLAELARWIARSVLRADPRTSTRLGRVLLSAVVISVAAQVGTAPLTIREFGWIAPGAVLLNLVYVPWAAVMLTASLIGALLVPVPGTTPAVTLTLDLLVSPLRWLEWIPAGAGWTLLVSPAAAWAPLLLATAVVLAASGPTNRRRLAAGLLAVLGLSWLLAPVREMETSVTALDVGQGDAILLRSAGRSVLVDGGGRYRGDTSLDVLVPALSVLGVRRLDLAVVTHGDRDHCLGVRQLLRVVAVDLLWVGPGVDQKPCGAELVRAAGSRATVVAAGDVGRFGGWSLTVLSALDAESSNASSVVIRAAAGSHSVLLPGDIDRKTELALVEAAGGGLASGVLKVPHHGSRSSSSGAFLDSVAPRLALISAGSGNAYGHPANAVVERLERRGALVLRTDLDGRIVVTLQHGMPSRIETVRARFAGRAVPP